MCKKERVESASRTTEHGEEKRERFAHEDGSPEPASSIQASLQRAWVGGGREERDETDVSRKEPRQAPASGAPRGPRSTRPDRSGFSPRGALQSQSMAARAARARATERPLAQGRDGGWPIRGRRMPFWAGGLTPRAKPLCAASGGRPEFAGGAGDCGRGAS